MNFKKDYLYAFIFLIVLGNFFQNCSMSDSLGFQSLSQATNESSLNGANAIPDISHPSMQALSVSSQSARASNKLYVATLLQEIFSSTTSPVPGLDDLLERWIITRGAQFGLGCDPYSSYSSRDCDGGDISAANLEYYTDDNTVRESFRLQFCDRVLGMDQGLKALLEKVDGVTIDYNNLGNTTIPNTQLIVSMYGLFYRGDYPSSDVILALNQLDHSLADNNENNFERWRGLALTVCQSSGWQLF